MSIECENKEKAPPHFHGNWNQSRELIEVRTVSLLAFNTSILNVHPVTTWYKITELEGRYVSSERVSLERLSCWGVKVSTPYFPSSIDSIVLDVYCYCTISSRFVM